MTNILRSDKDSMIVSLFIKMLPVEIGLVAMGGLNSIVDGIVAGRFINSTTIGVIGLYYTMMRILEAVGGLMLGGTSVMCGRYLGSGNIDKTRGTETLSIMSVLIIGAFLTVSSLLFPETIARMLGADANLAESTAAYVSGYAYGIIPMLVGQQLAACLQLENRIKRGHFGIVAMIASNCVLDLFFVVTLKMGIWGLALSTSVSNWVYFCVVGSYYLSEKAQLKPSIRLIDWSELAEIVKIGFPNALLVICLAGRSLVLNRLLLSWAGEDGLAALSAFNMISGLILSIILGSGTVLRMMASVFLGEENREDLIALFRFVFTRLVAVMLVPAAIIVLLAPFIAGVFFPDTSSNVHILTRQLIIIYACCIPPMLVCSNYFQFCQAMKIGLYNNLVSMVDGFFSVVIPAVLLAPLFGAMGVYLSFPIGIVITMLFTVCFISIRNGHFPRTIEEWMLLNPGFGGGEHLALIIESLDEVAYTAEKVQRFCDQYGVDPRTGMQAGLCMEEISHNIFQHGFKVGRREHSVEIRVVLPRDKVVLRIKDDGVPFNPKEWHDLTRLKGPGEQIGIHMVFEMASDINYQNLMGLNVLTIRLDEKAVNSAGV